MRGIYGQPYGYGDEQPGILETAVRYWTKHGVAEGTRTAFEEAADALAPGAMQAYREEILRQEEEQQRAETAKLLKWGAVIAVLVGVGAYAFGRGRKRGRRKR